LVNGVLYVRHFALYNIQQNPITKTEIEQNVIHGV
jgi:hypothetical protein